MNVLISLVGSNPLPIYVVAKYASMKNRSEEDKLILPVPDKHLFVYTDNTKQYYKNLKHIFGEKDRELKINTDFINLENKQHNSQEIINKVTKELEKIEKNEKIDTLIINNTGGTKTMAVYATLAVLQYAKDNKIKEFECYLDSNDNLIRVNSMEEGKMKFCPQKGDLRQLFNDTDIFDILFMHEMKNDKNKQLKESSFEEIEFKPLDKERLIAFANVITRDDEWKKYKKLFEDVQAIKVAGKAKVFKSVNKHMNLTTSEIKKFDEIFKDKIEDYKNLTSDKQAKVCKYVCKCIDKIENSWLKEALFGINEIAITQDKNYLKKFYDFLLGKWLEQYMLFAIEEAVEIADLKDQIKIYHSFECRILEGSDEPKFEVDIVLLKGYQIIAFSCTSADDNYHTKMKGFEVLHRVEQLGGEHAKAYLINMMDDNENLTNELKSFNYSVYKSGVSIGRDLIGKYNELVNRLVDIISQ